MARKRRAAYAKVYADLLDHPKTLSSAKTLKLEPIYVVAHLTWLWIKALDYAEDGDLWRGDDEASLRLFESLANIREEPLLFLEVFRRDRWIDGWLIHDWLDFNSEILISRHSSHNRPFLMETYKKHNRQYGKGVNEDSPPLHPDGVQGRLLGRDWEVVGNNKGNVGDNSDPPVSPSPKAQTETETKALSPPTPENKGIRSPKGGMGEEPARSPPTTPRANFKIVQGGSRVTGYPESQAELTGNGWTHKEVFEAFFPLLAAHAILSLEAFYERVKRSKATPATWIMLYLDKIHAVYREREGGTLLDEDADPIGMTMAGLMPGQGRRRHHHTEAARSLFIEIMMDYKKSQKGERSKWQGKLSGPAIVVELERRKGKASKIA